MSEVAVQDPILTPSESRYVMFPIQDNEIWQMYKKQIDCFWRAEEIDFSKDLTDWNNKLNDDERYFISMILAFFSNADGVVSENLAIKFMNDVQLSEARAFYGFQIAMENIHCVIGSTKILTDKGYYDIEDHVDKKVNIWNGEEFTEVEVKYTGHQAIFKIELSNGMELDCTSGHKWLIRKGLDSERIETKDLTIGDVISEYKLPVIQSEDPDEFMNPYTHGFSCGNNNIYDIGKCNKPRFEVPINYSIKTKLSWLEGYLDANGYITNTLSIQVVSYNFQFLKDVQLLLTSLGVHTNIDSTGEYILYITNKYVKQLMSLGFQTLELELCKLTEPNNDEPTKNDMLVRVKSIQKISDNEATFCFNEPKLHTGIFNGILTGQSETYSLMIDTYIKDKEQQDKMFNAVVHFPCIARKTTWAKKWISDKKSPFAARLVAFAVVEGIFFSASFASIYWLKKRGLLPGLTFSNELISRDEAMHCEFAVLIYSKLTKKLTKKRVYDIIQEAVEIEKDFITEAIPCRLIGMNNKLMCQYIEFVADRLCLQLGYDKIYNSQNPFDFMELISIESKVNFFERTNSEYALANKTMDDDIFKFTADF